MIKIKDLELPFQLDSGAPTPLVFSNDQGTHLFFYTTDSKIVKIKFHFCQLYKFGSPNDEVLHGHSYYNFGLNHYSICEVLNSDWIDNLKKINSVHSNFNENNYDNLKHYVFCFHDSTFECLSEGFEFELYEKSLADVIVDFVDGWKSSL